MIQLIKSKLKLVKNMVERSNSLPSISGVNENFFEKFGDPNDSNSFLYSSKLVTVRHA